MAKHSTLYTHTEHPYKPKSIHETRKEEHDQGNAIKRFNAWLAIQAYTILSSMWTFYAFVLLSATGFPGIPWITCSPQAFVSWLSSQSFQLWALPLLGAATVLVGKAAEHLAKQQYEATMRTLHGEEQMIQHMNAQDEKIIEMVTQNTQMMQHLNDQDEKILFIQKQNEEQLRLIANMQQQILTLSQKSEPRSFFPFFRKHKVA